MEWQGWFSLLLTLVVLLTLIFTRIKPHIVMMAALSALSVSGVLDADEALAGFANPGLITVAAMFIVAAGIHSSGGIDLLVEHLLGSPKTVRQAMARIFIPVVGLSGFLNNTPVVATMIPAINAWSRRINIPASKLMIPLSYSAIIGGTLTLIGTSTNLVVNGQYQSLTGDESFSIFSIGVVGLPVACLALIFMFIFFPRWLPDRGDRKAFANLREFTLEVVVSTNGYLEGKSIQEAGLRNLRRVYLVEIIRGDNIVTAVPSEERLVGGDRLVFAGDTEAISDLLRIKGLEASTSEGPSADLTVTRADRCLVEAVVSPHCDAIGYAIRDSRFRDRYGAAVLAVARNGERVQGNLGTIRLKAGDTLLLEARPAFASRQRHNKDFLLVNDLDQQAPRHERAYLSWAILFVVVAAAGIGLISMLNASLIGAGLMIATRCLSVSQAEKSLDLTVITVIAASFALGAALQKTGVAGVLADTVIYIADGRAWLLLILTYFAVSILTEIITNNAAAMLMLPVVLEITQRVGLNNEPFVFAIMMAASASFATPLGYQTNLMVYGPGGYRFTDFVRVGLPMNLFVGISTLTVLLLGWDLYKP